MIKCSEGDAMEKSVTNAELSKLLEKTLTRFHNWKIEVERNQQAFY